MIDKIEVGEHIRTKAGHFHKITGIDENELIYFDNLSAGWSREQFDNIVKKHSKQLIDLREVGDYVNGYRVIMNLKESKKHYDSKDDFVTCQNYTFEENEIKAILTKKQFLTNCYKVGEEDEC